MADQPNAVSFANNYFVLADGLVPGIEKYLDKHVVLNWFGRTIRGSHKVATFFNNFKVSTTHTFSKITPTDHIKYQIYNSKKSEPNRNDNDETMNNQLEQVENTSNCEYGASKPEVDKSEQISEEKASECELNENDLNSLKSEPERSSDAAANKNKVEEMMSQFKNIEMKCGHGNDPEVFDTKSNAALMCVEARGTLQCSDHKKHASRTVSYYHNWKRNCKLLIAYSLGKPDLSKPKGERKSSSRMSEYEPSKLPTFDEVIAMSNKVVPDTDHFGGYLREYHFYSERRKFNEEFKSEILKPKSEFFSKTLQHHSEEKIFAFDYTIHFVEYISLDEINNN